MSSLADLFDQFVKERIYLKNVSRVPPLVEAHSPTSPSRPALSL
jgi:hypothetical protein